MSETKRQLITAISSSILPLSLFYLNASKFITNVVLQMDTRMVISSMNESSGCEIL